MEVVNWKNVGDLKVEGIPYKDKMQPVKGISIRWLSKAGKDKDGKPEYGLRFFTGQPGAEIPIHNHFYAQTMYIMSGQSNGSMGWMMILVYSAGLLNPGFSGCQQTLRFSARKQ